MRSENIKTVSQLVILEAPHQTNKPTETVSVKPSRSDVHRKIYRIPEIRFEDQRLTSFAGIVLLQPLFSRLGLKEKFSNCFRHLKVSPIFGHHMITLLLVVHLILGYRRLQDIRYYRDDPMVLRLLGLERLPDVATVSRAMASMDEQSVSKMRQVNRQVVMARLAAEILTRITLDFDGSVLSTSRFAEGTAVGFNKKKKGQRSYYPLFCTIAQTGQVFDVWHRPGNVHDSNGARDFILDCICELRAVLPRVAVEVRMDSAFFSDGIVSLLEQEGVEFTISVPFERFTELKGLVEGRKRWSRLSGDCDYFEAKWKPKSWNGKQRFLFIRTTNRRQYKGLVQLDLFIPYEYGYDFKVIVTNKTTKAKNVLLYHNGRGAQEGIFAELKSQAQMDYIPSFRQVGNQVFTLTAVLAHNIIREMQMMANEKQRATTDRRTPLWIFEQLDTIRRKLIQRAGRLTRPQGSLTLTMSANDAVKSEFLHYLDAMKSAA